MIWDPIKIVAEGVGELIALAAELHEASYDDSEDLLEGNSSK